MTRIYDEIETRPSSISIGYCITVYWVTILFFIRTLHTQDGRFGEFRYGNVLYLQFYIALKFETEK